MKKQKIIFLLAVFLVLVSACGAQEQSQISDVNQQAEKIEEPAGNIAQPIVDGTYNKKEGIEVIYLAGGCFWGIEKLMQSIPGVVNATSGYANGQPSIVPTYPSVSSGLTGYRETVRVEYDPNQISLDALLFTFFRVIDPTVENAQGNDIGSQYQTGVYYTDEASKAAVEHIASIERERSEKFVVEIESLERFYDAEEYHQDYLDKNPGGYCHITGEEFESISGMVIDPGDYRRPSIEIIKKKLSEEQYYVTQLAGTEPSFQNAFWDHFERGIYVDVVTGEPLFSSSDKFASSSGWPSFSKGMDVNTFVFLVDTAFNMRRIEVRSRAGNSHLGHVFDGDPSSPNGIRYCINSAALRFVPYKEMESEGYGYLMKFVD